MSDEVHPVEFAELPFDRSGSGRDGSIHFRLRPSEPAEDEGEDDAFFAETIAESVAITALPGAADRLIDGDRIVVEDRPIVLVLDYPMDRAAVSLADPDAGDDLTLRGLILATAEAYRTAFDMERQAYDAFRRGEGITRPPFGIFGHGIDDLFIEYFAVFDEEDAVWILAAMGS
ncbi:MAG: hypothetical protein AAF899_03800 [Pseudomonadota bacterium]